jgi:hypothetical protein
MTISAEHYDELVSIRHHIHENLSCQVKNFKQQHF